MHRAVVRIRRDVERVAGGPEGERPGVDEILGRARVAGQVREVDVDRRAAPVQGEDASPALVSCSSRAGASAPATNHDHVVVHIRSPQVSR